MTDDIYFANKPKEDLEHDLYDWVKDYYDYIMRIGVLQTWRNSYRECFKGLKHNGRLLYNGEKGEYRTLFMNQYRSFGQNITTSITNIRPAWEPKAVNSDYETAEQVKIAKPLLDYYMDQKKGTRCLDMAASDAVYYGEGFVFSEWDPALGEALVPDETGRITYEGDVKYTNLLPVDVITDPSLRSWDECTWYILRKWVNKYELAAKYPNDSDAIMPVNKDFTDMWISFWNEQYNVYQKGDMIACYEFYHKKTNSCPDGRYAFFVKNKILNDGPLPTRDLYLTRICPIEMRNTRFGYSVMFDLLPIQKGYDILYSTIMTNQANFGVQNIMAPRGANLNVSSLAGGLNYITYDPMVGKPESVNFTQTSPEIFKFVDVLEGQMSSISGVNQTSRGNPPANVTSGVAIALQNASQDQYTSYLKNSWMDAIAKLGSNTLHLLQDFANTNRVLTIVGRDNRSYLQGFKGADIKDVDRVVVDPGNPINQTVAGRMNLAELLLKNGYVQSPEQIIEVMTTGRIEPMFKSLESELMNIKLENTRMMDASPNQPMVIKTDNHKLHILEHKVVLDDPDMRSNPMIVTNVLNHIQEHENAAYDMGMNDPYLAMVLNEQVPMGLPQAPPPPQGANHPSAGALNKQPIQGPPETRKINDVKNPVTGEQLAGS